MNDCRMVSVTTKNIKVPKGKVHLNALNGASVSGSSDEMIVVEAGKMISPVLCHDNFKVVDGYMAIFVKVDKS